MLFLRSTQNLLGGVPKKLASALIRKLLVELTVMNMISNLLVSLWDKNGSKLIISWREKETRGEFSMMMRKKEQ